MALKKKYKVLITILVLLVLGILFYKFFIQIRHVKAGEIGIKASPGSPVDNSADYDIEAIRGYVVFMPLYTDFVVYPTTIQVVSYDSMQVSSKDGIEFQVKPNVSFQLDESKATQFYKVTRSSLEEVSKGYLKEIVASSYVSAANSFTADSLATNERQFDATVNIILAEKMNEFGLILKNTVSNLEYPESIKAAIALRVKTLQDALIAEHRLREVDAIRREDSLRYSALTHLAIQKLFIDKWDGKLTSGGGEVSRIYDSISKNAK